MTCILELNDAAVTLYRNHTVLRQSPGVAVVLDDDVHFGEDALRLSRIHPRQTNQQYFTRLSADPLPAPGKRARNHADLVYLHLMTFKALIEAEGGDVLLAVPGILTADQLGVLLGVLQEVGIAVAGFVDAAVAALSTRTVPPRAYHLDVMMQRAVLTTVETADGSVHKVAAHEIPECGLSRLLDAWINVIADRFVRETRFDPLHAAATEQQLFNQVYDWIEGGAKGGELAVEVVHADHTRRVDIARGVLEEKAHQRLKQIADAVPRGADVFLSARSARLPGLHLTLEALQNPATDLGDDALVRGCLHNLSLIVPDDGELRLVTRLPLEAGPADTPASGAPAPEPAAAPTHALNGHEARPLEDGPLPLRRENGRMMLDPQPGLRLNGEPVQHASALAAGDRVVMGEREYLIIRVEA